MLLGSSFAGLIALLVYLVFFLFIACALYFIVRRAVRDGIMDARAKVKELEDPKTPMS